MKREQDSKKKHKRRLIHEVGFLSLSIGLLVAMHLASYGIIPNRTPDPLQYGCAVMLIVGSALRLTLYNQDTMRRRRADFSSCCVIGA